VKELVKRVAKALLWPVSRFFDPRFEGINQALHANTVASIEATTLLGRSLADLQAQVEANAAEFRAELAALRRVAEVASHEAAKASGTYLERLTRGDPRDVDPIVAPILERETGAEGHAARYGLWFNPPVWVGYESAGVVLRGVNERIAEVPYVFAAVAKLPLGSTVLDVGAAESTVARLRGDGTRHSPLPFLPPAAPSGRRRGRGVGDRRTVRRRRLPLHDRAHRARSLRGRRP
jgi:hypothetical protein